MKPVDVLGWLSSVVLLVTLGTQVRKQWRSKQSAGVSKWLFVGQTAASLGFTLYSWLVHNWVFVVTNSLILVSAIVGCVMSYRFRSGSSAAPPSRPEPAPPSSPDAVPPRSAATA